MHSARTSPIFENRFDAGSQLAGKLAEYQGQPVVVLAIPNGGLPVALQVALALGADLDVVISRKLPILYRGTKPLSIISGKTVIIVDDGLASGYTMIAAVESVRRSRPARVVVAVPAASEAAVKRLEEVVDQVVTVATGGMSRFYIADYYRYWHALSDEEGLKCLKEYRMRRFAPNIEPSPDRPNGSS